MPNITSFGTYGTIKGTLKQFWQFCPLLLSSLNEFIWPVNQIPRIIKRPIRALCVNCVIYYNALQVQIAVERCRSVQLGQMHFQSPIHKATCYAHLTRPEHASSHDTMAAYLIGCHEL